MRHASLPLLLLLLGLLYTPANADVTTGLIAWYPFDGGLLDASGNGNHGVAVGGLLPTTDRFGTPNAAYEFNGTNSYVSIANSASLSSPDTALTQSAWVLFYGPSLVGQAYGPVTMKSTSTVNAFMYRMTATPGSGFAAGFNDWFHSYGASYPFDLGEWYHIATVFDGSSVLCYLNGTRVDSVAAPITMINDSRDLTIGADIPGILEIFYGKIDDLRIYSRALSDEDIAELCSCGPTGIGDTPPLRDFAIRRAYPNPTSSDTRVDFVLGSDAPVDLSVYDVAGRRVRGLRSGSLGEGNHSVSWDGRNESGAMVPSGVYFVRLLVSGNAVSTRVIRVR